MNSALTVLHITKGSDLLMIDGGKSMIGEWIKLAGGKSVLPDEANMITITSRKYYSSESRCYHYRQQWQ